MNWAELVAVLLALAYVVLAIKEQRSCFIAGALSAAIYIAIFWQARLLMESALQGFYIAMSVYGWWHWQNSRTHKDLPISTLTGRQHVIALFGIAIASLAIGDLMSAYTEAAYPYADAATTVAAIFATWLVARKVLENWLYWIAIDAVSVVLYSARGLDLTAGLFVGYVILAFAGYLSWRQSSTQTASVA